MIQSNPVMSSLPSPSIFHLATFLTTLLLVAYFYVHYVLRNELTLVDFRDVPKSDDTNCFSEYIGTCSEKQRNVQSKVFREGFVKWAPKSSILGCTQLPGLSEFLASIWNPKDEKIVLLNIGANKGYNEVEWIQAWAPQLGKGPFSWGKELRSLYPDIFVSSKLCGVCQDCKHEPLANSSQGSYDWLESGEGSKGLFIYAMEPSLANFELLQHLKDWANFKTLTVLHSAASNISGIGKFPVTKLGSERGKLGDDLVNNTIEIKIQMVDSLMEELHLSHVHFMKVDTEGHDALVLEGATKTLKSRSISVVVFEYHQFGPWNDTQLKKTVETLDNFGYECFLHIPYEGPTRVGVIRLTSCWEPLFEFHQWSNVLCYDRNLKSIGRYVRQFWLDQQSLCKQKI